MQLLDIFIPYLLTYVVVNRTYRRTDARGTVRDGMRYIRLTEEEKITGD